MTETIIPEFRNAPNEAMIIGRILAGYSELEVELLGCVMRVKNNNVDQAVRALYSERGERRRIEKAKAIIGKPYIKAGLEREYVQCIADLDHCRLIRNQYAHCQWYYTAREGLCFADLERLANQPANIAALMPARLPVDVTLLSQQEQFFKYVQKCLWYLDEHYSLSQQAAPKSNPLCPLPRAMTPPPLHN
jgi:hypothetical protein